MASDVAAVSRLTSRLRWQRVEVVTQTAGSADPLARLFSRCVSSLPLQPSIHSHHTHRHACRTVRARSSPNLNMEEHKRGESADDRIAQAGQQRSARGLPTSTSGGASSSSSGSASERKESSTASFAEMETDEIIALQASLAAQRAEAERQLEEALQAHQAAAEEAAAHQLELAQLQQRFAQAEMEARQAEQGMQARAGVAADASSRPTQQQAEREEEEARPESPAAAARAGLWRLLQDDMSDDSGDDAYEDDEGSSGSEDEFFDAQEQAAVAGDDQAGRAQGLQQQYAGARAQAASAGAGGATGRAHAAGRWANAAERHRRRNDTDSEGSDSDSDSDAEQEEAEGRGAEAEAEAEGFVEYGEEGEGGEELGQEAAALGAQDLAEMGIDVPPEEAADGAFVRFLRAMEGHVRQEGGDDGQEEDEDEDPRPGQAEIAVARRIARLLRQAVEARDPAGAQREARRREQAQREREEMAAAELARPIPPVDPRPVGIHSAVHTSHWFAARHTEEISVRPPPQAEVATMVTAEQVAYGRDPQGIPWARLRRRRVTYRAERLERYPLHHPDLPTRSPTLQAERTAVVAPLAPLYDFHRSLLCMRPTYFHPQLRHLLHAPSSVDVVAMCADYAVQAVNLAAGPLTSAGTVEEETALREERMAESANDDSASISAARGVAPPEPPLVPQPVLLYDFSQTNLALTSMLALSRWPLLMLGSMRGELQVRNWRSGALLHTSQVTDNPNAICNAITMAASPIPPLRDELADDGSLLSCPGTSTARFFVSDNDCFARAYDLATLRPLRDYPEAWPVNYAAVSSDGRTLALGGDSHAALLRDAESGQLLCTLHGHRDDIFSLSFHPTRPLLATGAQDHSARVFDLRKTDRPLFVLAGHMAPVRSVQFSHAGDFLAVAEGADFVHLVDMCASTGDSLSVQSIDLFGEITGAAFSPDDASLFIGVTDAVYGGVVEYRRPTKRTPLLDLFFD